MKTQLAFFLTLGSILASPLGSAQADGIKCDKLAKKIQWNICIDKPVEYKRGLKKESRDECAVNKAIKPKSACNLGNLYDYVPEGEDPYKAIFYATVPANFDDRDFEIQREAEEQMCGAKETTLEHYKLMKFSDAFDKDNRERGLMVDAKLKKKKKKIMKRSLRIAQSPYGGCENKKTILGAIDKKSQSKFLYYAESHTTKK